MVGWKQTQANIIIWNTAEKRGRLLNEHEGQVDPNEN